MDEFDRVILCTEFLSHERHKRLVVQTNETKQPVARSLPLNKLDVMAALTNWSM
jgi:hypothetical protein